jgi:hypothetical protein
MSGLSITPAFAAFHDFVSELNRFEKFRLARLHYPQPLWHRALQHADQRHTARALSTYYLALDADIARRTDDLEYRAPTSTYHEKLYADSLGRMNGKPLRLVSV